MAGRRSPKAEEDLGLQEFVDVIEPHVTQAPASAVDFGHHARSRLPNDVALLVGGTEALQRRAEVEAAGARLIESLAEFRALLPRLAEGPPR